ncbi:Caskin1, partial [Symbiodinium necroappetens]
MDGIPVLGIEVLGPERRTPVEVVRQLRASQPSSQPASEGTSQREPPQSLLRRTGETGRSSQSSKSRSLSPSRRLPAPGEVPWQKFWNTKDARDQGQGRSRIRQASARASSRSPSTRPSSPLMVDSRSASMNERRRPAELQSQEKAPQTRDFSPYSPLFRVSWDPST